MTVIVFRNSRVFDGHAPDYAQADVVVADGLVQSVERHAALRLDHMEIECRGRVLMPGLIDAHFHAYSPDLDVQRLEHMPWALLGLHAAAILRDTLHRGFTTVRDAGGGDHAIWQAAESGLIESPRIFFSGRALSQTGGHGDFRNPRMMSPCSCGAANRLTVVADGVEAVRAAAREELRLGAHQLKIFMSGGVLSLADPIWMPQYSNAEIQAAVEEAATRNTYVMAHCHTNEAAQRCVALGVRSIEHGTQIDPTTARAIAQTGSFVVPTLTILHLLSEAGPKLGIADVSLQKVSGLYEQARESIANCRAAGVSIGFGTDLMGTLHDRQNDEFTLRSELMTPLELLRSATSVNAALIKYNGKLGCIAPGAFADLLVVDGDPLADPRLLSRPQTALALIMSRGRIVKTRLRNARC
jgi:imidazolonepropionase-like amidohydrolase